MDGCALVSVVIPTHRRPQWVVCAIESALGQSYAQLEVIVVIDGPDTETMPALQRFNDERLRVIELEVNIGGSEARNAGVRAARGEWVGQSFKCQRLRFHCFDYSCDDDRAFHSEAGTENAVAAH